MKNLLPPPGLPRALSVQSVIYSIGAGAFLSASVVFFTKVAGLSAAEVGIGLSVAGLVSFLLAVPLGSLADRVGTRKMWLYAVLVEAGLYFLYPVVRGFWAYLGIVVVLATVEVAGNSGRGAYTIEVLPPELRVKTMAYIRSALNIGFTVGAGLAGLALAIDQQWAYYGLALTNGVVLLANGAFISRLPQSTAVPRPKGQPRLFAVLRDRPFLAISSLNGALQVHVTLISVVVPLWIISRTDAPKALLAVLVVMNTAAVILLQVPVSRGSEHVVGAIGALRRAGFWLAAGCAVLAISGMTSGWATIAALVAGYMLITVAELLQSAGQWGLSAELPPADRRAEYLGAMRLGGQGQRMIAPALLTAVVMTWSGAGWAAVGVLCLALGIAAVPVIGWAASRVGPKPTSVAETGATNLPAVGGG